jgi:probable addiction module antidote protein
MTLETYPFEVSEFLDPEEGIAEYLRLVCEDGSPAEIARALGDIAKARGMSEIAQKTGLARAERRGQSGAGDDRQGRGCARVASFRDAEDEGERSVKERKML